MDTNIKPVPRRQRILEFVRKNPGCYTRDVADAFGLGSRHIGSELDQLARGGAVICEREEGGRRFLWTATGRVPTYALGRCEVPSRPVIKSWPLHLVRDPLTAALFGPAKQPQGEAA